MIKRDGMGLPRLGHLPHAEVCYDETALHLVQVNPNSQGQGYLRFAPTSILRRAGEGSLGRIIYYPAVADQFAL